MRFIKILLVLLKKRVPKQSTEAAVRRCSSKRLLLKIHNIQRKAPELRSLFNKVAGLKKRLQHRCFPMNISKFLRTPIFMEHPWWLLLTVNSSTHTFHFSENLEIANSSKINSGQNFIGKIALNVPKTWLSYSDDFSIFWLFKKVSTWKILRVIVFFNFFIFSLENSVFSEKL